MNLTKTFTFVFHSLTAGLAAAFVIVVFFPELLLHNPVMEVREGRTSAVAPSPEDQKFGAGRASYAQAVTRAAAAVVNIHSAKVVGPDGPLLDDPFFRRFFGDPPSGPRERVQTSLGSGVIVSPQGHILTNHHVIADADRIQVMLQDGRTARAEIVGTDPDTDLAVLEIALRDELPTIAVRGSQALRVGDVVLAIGNPFGVGQTVTMGIVSATGRNRLGINTFEDFIQTDAAINPGNSGGALIDAHGRLIGINTAIFSRSGGSQGIGFAIPAGLALNVMRQIIEQGYVARGWLGIEVQPLTRALAESFGLETTEGVVVVDVFPDSPAARAGLKQGDVITRIAEQRITDARSALETIVEAAPGTQVQLGIVRDGAAATVQVTASQRPSRAARR
ncbi:MAG: PDZ domain-containing protein [Gammaproteobacteria bacterium]|nr:PDZ domain-containing protein [Gammaproteobacteria bacterium]NIR82284.1 PDZ domain-containing protein [Gammaproteobacteria bacterium]NIR91215.1 PDZ domain-containing protein [Gammaproteobacteria bacterium]NIU03433.1 PDZ domain-containing protein [Gammaproteobacteria bacterium]NIX84708.1 PDZ domain-containing protein [Gammaproteobacteria bacterium]